MESCSIISWQIEGEKVEAVTYFLFLGSKITVDGDCSHEIRRQFLLGRKAMTNLDSVLKSRDITLPTKGPSSQGYGFSSGHVWIWELDCEESWAPRNWCFWSVVLEKTLESPLDCKEIQPVYSKGDHPWVRRGRQPASLPAFGSVSRAPHWSPGDPEQMPVCPADGSADADIAFY